MPSDEDADGPVCIEVDAGEGPPDATNEPGARVAVIYTTRHRQRRRNSESAKTR